MGSALEEREGGGVVVWSGGRGGERERDEDEDEGRRAKGEGRGRLGELGTAGISAATPPPPGREACSRNATYRST